MICPFGEIHCGTSITQQQKIRIIQFVFYNKKMRRKIHFLANISAVFNKCTKISLVFAWPERSSWRWISFFRRVPLFCVQSRECTKFNWWMRAHESQCQEKRSSSSNENVQQRYRIYEAATAAAHIAAIGCCACVWLPGWLNVCGSLFPSLSHTLFHRTDNARKKCVWVHGHIRQHKNPTELYESQQHIAHIRNNVVFVICERTCWKCVCVLWQHAKWINRQMAFCFLFCRCLFFSLRSVGWSFGLGAMRFISKMTHFTMLEANIHTYTHANERKHG